MTKPKQGNTSYIGRRLLTLLSIFALLVVSLFSLTRVYTYTRLTGTAEAATNNTLNFQARILSSTGAVVPDGYYNVQFKLYDGGTQGGGAGTGQANAGSLLWTESYYDTNGATAGNDFRVRVVNGYFSVNLGSLTNFPAINFDQELWLTMNIGGSTQTASPTYDGEMLGAGNTRTKLTAVPYAFQAAKAAALEQNQGTFSGNVNFATLTANRTYILPDTALATTASPGTICVYNGSVSNCPAATGSTAYIQNGTGTQTSANFNIQAANSTTNGTIGGVIRGAAGGQTVDLFQLQNPSGTPVAKFGADGSYTLGTNSAGATITQNAQTGFRDTLKITRGGTGVGGIGVDAAGTSLQVYTGSTANADANVRLTVTASGNVGIGDATPASLFTVGNGDTFQIDGSGAIIAATGIATTGNFNQTGTGTFGTGTGAVSLNGNTTVTTGKNFAVTNGTTTLGGTLAVTGTTTLNNTLTVSAGTGIVADFSGRVKGGDAVNTDEFVTLGQINATVGNYIQNQYSTPQAANLYITSSGPAGTPTAAIKAASGQTGNLLELQDTSAVPVFSVSTTGSITTTGSFAQTGSGTFSTGTGAVSLNGATTVTTGKTFTVTDSLTTLGGGLSVTGASSLAGNVTITSSNTLTVGGATTLSGTLAVTGTSTYTGASTFNGGVTVANNSNFAQTGSGTFSTGTGTVSLNGDTTVTTGKNFTVTNGTTTLGGNTSITGSSTFSTGTGTASLNGNTTVTGTNTFTVNSGATSLGGTLTVTGNTSLNGNVTLGDAAADAVIINAATITRTAAGTTTINLSDAADTTLALQNSGTGNAFLTVDGSITAGTGLTVTSGPTSLGGTLAVTGTSTFTGAATFNGGVTVANNSNFAQTGTGTFSTGTGTVSLNGATTVNSTLAVTTLGSATSDTVLCRNSSNQLATCNSTFATTTQLGNYVQFAPASAQTDTTANSSIYINKTNAAGNILQLQKNGADALVLDNNGSLGIGAASTGAKLYVKQSSDTSTSGLQIVNSSATRALYLWADSSQVARIDSQSNGGGMLALNGGGTGNVGIGTTNPQAALDISRNQNGATSATVRNGNTGTAAASGFSAINNVAGGLGQGFFGVTGTGYTSIPLLQNMAVVYANTGLSGVAIDTGSAQPIVFGINNSEAGRFDASGNFNVGGDATPDALFTVGNTSQFQVNASGAIAAATGIATTGNFAQSGAGTFSTGTGNVSLNGATTVSSTLAVNTLGTADTDAVLCRNSSNQLASCNSTFATTTQLAGYVQLQATTPGTAQTGNINISGTIIAGSFSGNGAGLTNLNASNIATGTLSDARLSTNVALLNATQTFSAANTFSATGTALSVTNNASIGGTATIGTLSVTGAATIGTTLGVTGATTLSSTLAVTGTSTFTGAATFNGGVTVANNSNFAQTGTGTFSTGTGTVSLNGDTTVTTGKNFTVTNGTTTLGGTLGVTGAATFNGNVTLGDASTDTVTLNANVITRTAAGVTTINLSDAADTTLAIQNSGTGNALLSVDGSITAGTGLSVTSGATSLGGTLSVTGTSTFTGAATFDGGITDTGNFAQTGTGTFSTGTGAVSLNGNTTVTTGKNLTVTNGTTTLGGALTVNSTADINTSSTTALQVRNGGTTTLGVDTANGRVGVGVAPTATGSVLQIGTNTTTTTGGIQFGTDASATIYRSGSNALTIGGTLTSTGTFTLTNGNLQSTAATANLVSNAAVTTVNLGTNATTVSIGAATGTTTVNNGLTVTGATQINNTFAVSAGTGIVGTFSGRVSGANAVANNEFVTLQQLNTSTGNNGNYFLQDGNSFGVPAVLGTNDNFALNFETNGTTKLTVTTAGDLQFAQGANRTINVAAATSGTTGYNLTVAAGAAFNGTGGVLALQGGAAAGTNQNGGALTIDGGAPTGTGTRGTVAIQGGGGATTIGGNLTVDTSTFFVDAANNRVGVGTSSPGAIDSSATNVLEVNVNQNRGTSVEVVNTNAGGLAFSSFTAYNEASTAASVIFGVAGTAYANIGGALYQDRGLVVTNSGLSGLVLGNNSANPTIFVNAAVEVARFDNAGNFNVGGDTTPDALFTVGTASQFQVSSAGNVTAQTGLTFAGASGTISTSTANANLTLQANGTGTLAVDTTGAGTVNLGVTNATTINVGTGATARTIGIGNNTGATAVNVTAGTGGINFAAAANTFSLSSSSSNYVKYVSNSGASSYTQASNGNLLLLNNLRNISGTGITYDSTAAGSLISLGSGAFTVQVAASGTSGTAATLLVPLTINNDGTTTAGLTNKAYTLQGSSLILNAPTVTRTASGTTTYDFVDGSNTTLAITNSGAGVANLTVDGAATIAGLLTASNGLTVTSGATSLGGTLAVTGTSTFTGLGTFNGGLTVTTGQTFTVNGDAFTDLTGSGLTVSGGALTVDATSATGFFRNGGNSFGGTTSLGTNDANALNFRTSGTDRLSLSTTGDLTFAQASTIGVSAANAALTLQSNGTGAITVDSGTTGNVNIGTGANAKTVTVGNTTGASQLTLQAGSNGIVINASTIKRTAAGATTFDLIDAANTTFAISNSGAGVANLTVDGSATFATGLTVTSGTVRFGSLNSVGVVTTNASGDLATGVLGRNDSNYFSGTLSIANGGTGSTTFTGKGIVYANSGATALSSTNTAANSVLITNGTSDPSLSTTLPNAVQDNITRTGALASGSIAAGFGTISTNNSITTSTTIQGATVNATTAFTLGGANINTNGTLNNVAYLNGTNIFSAQNTFSGVGTGLQVDNNANVDGTLTANALTVTNTATFNGNIILGNASTDTVTLNSNKITRTAAGTTTIDLVDAAATTLAVTNSGAGVANLTVDGAATIAGLLTASNGLTVTAGATSLGGTLSVSSTSTFTGAATFTAGAIFNAATDLTTSSNGDLTLDANGTGLTVLNDSVKLNSIASATTNTYLCSSATGIISACSGSGSGAGFIQDGNSFGTTAVLGTNDNFNLTFETAGTTKLTLDTTGNLTFGQASTLSTSTGQLTVQSATGTLSFGSTTNLTANGALTLASGGTNTALSLQSNGTGAITLDSGTTGDINVGTSANAKTITIGNTTGATMVNINAGSGGVNVLGSANFSVGTGSATFGGTINANGGTIATTQTTANLLNTNATTVNAFGAASAINLGAAAGATITGGGALTLASGGTNTNLTLQANGTGVLALATGAVAGTAGTIQIGNTTGADTQAINIGTNATASSTSNVTIGSTVAGITALQGQTTITGRTTGAATTLRVNNNTSTGNILLLQDNGTAVFTVADGGSITGTGQYTFSGVATDITTGTNEDLTVVANGTGVINLNDDITAGGNLTFAMGATRTISIAQETGTTTGDKLSIKAGQGGASGAAGGVLELTGGAGAGTNQNGGNLTVDGGAATGTGSKGFVILQGAGGNVGIGTATPTYALEVNAASNYQALFKGTGANNGGIIIDTATTGLKSQLRFSEAGVGMYVLGRNTDNSFIAYDFTNNRNFLSEQTDGNLLLQEAGGNVEIGTTTNPLNGRLTVSSTQYNGLVLDKNSATDRHTQIQFAQQGTATFAVGVDPLDNNSNAFFVYDEVAGVNRFLIGSNGNVGIGNYLTDVGEKLRVEGNILSTDKVIAENEFNAGDNGSAGDPQYSFTNDGDTGFYNPSTNSNILGLTTNGVTRLLANDTGQIGIGNTLPTALLDIAGNNGSNSALKVNSSGAGKALQVQTAGTDVYNIYSDGSILQQSSTNSVTALQVKTTAASGGTTVFDVDTTNQRVGIGTTTPASALAVRSAGQNAVVNIYGVTAATDYGVIQVSNDGDLANSNNRSLVLQPNGGNVGIGAEAIAPIATLDVRGTQFFQNASGATTTTFTLQANAAQNTAGSSLIEFKNSSGIVKSYVDAYGNYSFVTGAIGQAPVNGVALAVKPYGDTVKGLTINAFSAGQTANLIEVVGTAPSKEFTVSANGNVGVGTTTTTGVELTVDTDVGDNNVALRVKQQDTTNNNNAVEILNEGTGYSFFIGDDGTTTDSTPTIIDDSGNFALGATTTGGSKFLVAGTSTATSGTYYGSQLKVNVTSGASTLTSSSQYVENVLQPTTGTTITGAASGSLVKVFNNGAGTVAESNSVVAQFGTQSTGSITSAAGVRIYSPTQASTGAIGTAYGVLIDSIKTGFVTTAYGVYQTGTTDVNFFGGNTRIGANTAANLSGAKLFVTGGAEVTGALRIGTLANGINFNDSLSGKLRFTGTAQNTKTVQLSPEYAGATITGTGIGTMGSDFCSTINTGTLNINPTICGTTQEHNYYSWTTTQGTAQSYDIYTRYQLPADFVSFTAGSFTINGQRSTTGEAVTLTAYRNGVSCGTASISGTATWGTTTGFTQSCSFAAGDTLTLRVTVTATSGNFARAGEINFSYLSNF